ncbi:MotA/TolQ/ExbB proton channel family protein [Saccharicrinis aurantiacus]|uniref:MotA/TolQ/ExbB proton channel family protein n=1 Tax=Saccharicrinis aurantiacus TaxID=1849719 RepID=UPI00094F98B5|nr:MotA/TolQ/ExbB proton channel family protein [Saccharicrinis aurantiacus]
MKELFFTGGTLFMSALTIMLLIIIGAGAYMLLLKPQDKVDEKLSLIKIFGLIALTIGILGQVIGLHQAFSYLGEVGSVEPKVMYGGIKVSMIPTMYGMVVYVVSLITYSVCKWFNSIKA